MSAACESTDRKRKSALDDPKLALTKVSKFADRALLLHLGIFTHICKPDGSYYRVLRKLMQRLDHSK